MVKRVVVISYVRLSLVAKDHLKKFIHARKMADQLSVGI